MPLSNNNAGVPTEQLEIRLEENPQDQIQLLSGLVSIADKYKSEIGFWPRNSIKDAIARGRLIAAVSSQEGTEMPVGFIISGGVFPKGSIQAVAVPSEFHRKGIAQVLLDAVISRFELEGYIAVGAKPASDLQGAQAFYENNEFAAVRSQSGGQARKREIVVRERLLGNRDLLSGLHDAKPAAFPHGYTSAEGSLWVIDINVLFDLVKAGRDNYNLALGVFSAALEGRVRLAVTSEFPTELSRRASTSGDDPLLQIASALPRLQSSSAQSLDNHAEQLHQLIFAEQKPSQAGTPQAQSDCKHLAECISGNARAFVTSDGLLLRNRRQVRERWGLDIVSLEDFNEALSPVVLKSSNSTVQGDGFHFSTVSASRANEIAVGLQSTALSASFFQTETSGRTLQFKAAIDNDGNPIGLSVVSSPSRLGKPHTVAMLIDNRRIEAELVAEVLLDQAVQDITLRGPAEIELFSPAGQIVVKRVALQFGFQKSSDDQRFIKTAIGAPITPDGLPKITEKLRLSYGTRSIKNLPNCFEDFDQQRRQGSAEFTSNEDILSPCLIITNDRKVCIQPIGASYADQLLGTSKQSNFLPQFEGAFRARKTYVSSGRSKNLFQPDQIILLRVISDWGSWCCSRGCESRRCCFKPQTRRGTNRA